MKPSTRIFILVLLSIIQLYKPIPYEDVVKYRSVRQEVLNLKGGGQDSTGKSCNIEDVSFIPPTTNSRSFINLDRQTQQPKAPKDQPKQNCVKNLKVTYKKPAAPSPSGLSAGDYDEDLPSIPEDDNSISDPEFWNKIMGQETDNSENKSKPTSPPTHKLTRGNVKESEFITKKLEPYKFTDWEGEQKTIKFRELKKSVFSHGNEAGISGPEDLVECPIQTDPTKHQRQNCSKVTDKSVQKFLNKIVNLAQSREPQMLKFITKMAYFDSQLSVAHIDISTGECVFFHLNGKYWSYKKYPIEDIPSFIANAHSSLKWASENSSPTPEL